VATGTAKRSGRRKRTFKPIEYIMGKGTSRLLNARVETNEIRLLVNGPTMLYGTCRLLTSLDAADGATFQAWTALAAAMTCTSHCGLNGTTPIPVIAAPSRIGTSLEFGTGPMSMYLATVVLKTKATGATFRQVIDEAFGHPKVRYQALIVPEAATGHLEHVGAIFDPAQFPVDANEAEALASAQHDSDPHASHVHTASTPRKRRNTGGQRGR
jgi:hypothetical protein